MPQPRSLKSNVTAGPRLVAAGALACVLGLAATARSWSEEPPAAAEIVIYGFEGGLEGWAIPDWAKSSTDHVASELGVSETMADEGHQAMALQAHFPGDGRWTGAYVERMAEITDWNAFGRLAVDIYVPAEAPQGLGARIILSVGKSWTWTEMNRSIPLTPGAWTTVTVNMKPGSMDWKFFPDEEFRRDVRKLGVRIESNKEPAYTGPIYIDNIRLSEQ